jgi:hypothetical protein
VEYSHPQEVDADRKSDPCRRSDLHCRRRIENLLGGSFADRYNAAKDTDMSSRCGAANDCDLANEPRRDALSDQQPAAA